MPALSLALFWATQQRIKEDEIPAGLELHSGRTRRTWRAGCVSKARGMTEGVKAMGKQSGARDVGNAGAGAGILNEPRQNVLRK